MHRLASLVAGATTALILAGCGNETFTITETGGGVTGFSVVTSDSTAIAALEAKLPSTATRTIQNGDTHSGAHVCGFSVTKDGHSYQVDYYGTAPSSNCNAAGQQAFLSVAP